MRGLAFLFLGSAIMVAQAEPRAVAVDDEFNVKVTFKRTAPGEPGDKAGPNNDGTWKDVPARLIDNKGVMIWSLKGAKVGVPRGPKKGDQVIEEDGTVWLVEKYGKGSEGQMNLTCTKVPPPKKP